MERKRKSGETKARVCIALPTAVLAAIDAQAKAETRNRSNMIEVLLARTLAK